MNNLFYRFSISVTLLLVVLFSCHEQQKQKIYPQDGINLSAGTYDFPEDPQTKKFLIKNIDDDFPDYLSKALVKYGYDILTRTSQIVGPNVEDENMRFAGNNLACGNCHVNGGLNAWGGSWIGVLDRYPTYRDKNGQVNDIQMRIGGCFERSLQGGPPANDSKEMSGIIEYFKWLSSDSILNSREKYSGYFKIDLPNRKADTIRGYQLYNTHCYICHGSDGEGVYFDKDDVSKGYIYPRLWGDSTYSLGAGMARLETFASFIKASMPYGTTAQDMVLSDEEAYDISGYVNIQERPISEGMEDDFPDRTTKGADVPYGPYIDDFPRIQHRLGPLQPIEEYYKSLKSSNESTKEEDKSLSNN
ncbi:MAG: c-type cytochrome [Dysgonamonadaceae bacterium]|nr:c-type cytochrome [Dysgonamonadaceae bacterium]